MAIRVFCPRCGKKLKAPDELAGKRARCPGCGAAVELPAAEPSAADGEGPPEQKPAARRRRDDGEWLSVPKHEEKDLIDMTAMVDVTFFLLIFFMVTSMHSLQTSISMPTPEASVGSRKNPAAVSSEGNQVVVRIDSDDSIWIDDTEVAATPQELISKLRESNEENMLVYANGEARHGTVVMVLDAGSGAGMEQIRLASAEEEGEE